ncbi:MAG: LexA family transcriptional regulator [Flavobacteriales bacterium]|nr:LexA family transcriptional regulator [Flavobacteriales bacterium]
MEENDRLFRVFDYLKEKGKISNYVELASILGTNKQGVNDLKSSRKRASLKYLQSMIKSYSEINPNWLLTGNGEMIKGKEGAKMQRGAHVAAPAEVKEKGAHVAGPAVAKEKAAAKETMQHTAHSLPLVSIEAVAGIGSAGYSIQESDIQAFYVVPDFKHVDFMLRVTGSSMYPKYNSGDIVACRILKDPQFIQWNKVHLIATGEQGILIKRLLQGKNKDTWLCVSDNKDYPPFEISRKDVTSIALVIGVIRLE